MTNTDAINALEQIKTYTSAELLDELEYVLEIMKKLEKAGISNPLKADFSKLAN